MGYSDQADASDPIWVEELQRFMVTFKVSSTYSASIGGGKGSGGVHGSVHVGKSKTNFESGSRMFKTLDEANDFRDNVRQRTDRSAFMPPPTSVLGALQIPEGESRGAGTATATTEGGALDIEQGLGNVGYTHVSTETNELSIMKVGPTTVDVTRTFSEDDTSDPHISGLGLSNTKGKSGETGRAVIYQFDLNTENGKAAFQRWCGSDQDPGDGATNKRIRTFRSRNAHDDYGFPVKFSASWKGRTWQMRDVDELGNVTETFGGGTDRDIRTGWFSENITRDKEQHANAQIVATLKGGKESYTARFTVSGKSGDSNLEELGQIFSGANHPAGRSSGYWLLTAPIDPKVVHELERDNPLFRNAKTVQERMEIYTAYEEQHGPRMIGGQVRQGGKPLSWNLELPGDPNFPGASGREALNQQRARLAAQLKGKPDSAGSIASEAKDTLDALKKRLKAVTDRKQYTDLPGRAAGRAARCDRHPHRGVQVNSESGPLRPDARRPTRGHHASPQACRRRARLRRREDGRPRLAERTGPRHDPRVAVESPRTRNHRDT